MAIINFYFVCILMISLVEIAAAFNSALCSLERTLKMKSFV